MLGKLWSKLDGYKLKIGGAASILTGLAIWLKDLSDGGSFTTLQEGWTYVLSGWGMIAAKSAIEKVA